MLSGDEKFRRFFILWHALWEAREELFKLSAGIDRDDLDWFSREKFDQAVDDHRRSQRKRANLLLRAAYDGDAIGVKCTPEEREAAMDMAFGVLEGNLLPDCAVDHLWSDSFP